MTGWNACAAGIAGTAGKDAGNSSNTLHGTPKVVSEHFVAPRKTATAPIKQAKPLL
jgi:hypothetical protein